MLGAAAPPSPSVRERAPHPRAANPHFAYAATVCWRDTSISGCLSKNEMCRASMNREGRPGFAAIGHWESMYAECRADLDKAAAYLIGTAEAEEVIQDAFEKAMRQADFFERTEKPPAWLRSVAVRLAVSRFRGRAVWERVRLGLVPGHAGMPDPELHLALRLLPPVQRGAIVLRYFYGFAYADIARALNLSERSIGGCSHAHEQPFRRS